MNNSNHCYKIFFKYYCFSIGYVLISVINNIDKL